MNPKEKSLREILQDFALNVQLDWDADAPEEVCQKKISRFCSIIQDHCRARWLSRTEIFNEIAKEVGASLTTNQLNKVAIVVFKKQEERDK